MKKVILLSIITACLLFIQPMSTASSYLLFENTTTSPAKSSSANFDVISYQDHVYLADNTGFQVLQLNNNELEQMSYINTNNTVYDMKISNSILYVAVYNNGIISYDLSSPDAPTFLDTVDLNYASSIDIVDNTLFAIEYQLGLVLYDISDPSNIVSHSSYLVDGAAAIRGTQNYAYVMTESNFQIFDVSNKAAISFVNSVNLETVGFNFAFENNISYVPTNGYVYMVNVSDPNSIGFESSISIPRNPYDLIVNDSKLFITQWRDGVDIYDLSNLKDISLISTVDSPRGSYGIHVNLEKIHISTGGDGLEIYNLSDVNNPSLTDWYDPYTTFVDAIEADDNYILSLSQFSGLRIWEDYSNPSLRGEFNPIYTLKGLSLMNDYAIVGYSGSNDADDNGMFIVDISVKTSPQVVGSYNRTGFSDFTVEGNHAYFLGYGELDIVDISDPINPVRSTNMSIPGYELYVQGDLAYIQGVSEDGLTILNVSDTSNPKILGSEVGTAIGEMAVKNGYAYILSNSNATMHIFDVSNPSNPKYLFDYELLERGYAIDFYDDLLFIQEYNKGNAKFGHRTSVEVLDLSNPYDLTRVGVVSYNITSNAHDIDVNNGILYLAMGSNGFLSSEWKIKLSDDGVDTTTITEIEVNSETVTTTETPNVNSGETQETDGGFLQIYSLFGIVSIAIFVIIRKKSN